MHEHIKTGDEIYLSVGNSWRLYHEYHDEKDIDVTKEKWVSLLWLQEQIKDKVRGLTDDEDFDRGSIWGLMSLYSLLEAESKGECKHDG